MSEPNLLERMRMCVAEIGYQPSVIIAPTDDQRRRGVDFVYDSDAVPARVVWSASGIADPDAGDDHLCWACHPVHTGPVLGERWLMAQQRCKATRPGVEDCGVDRSAP